MQFYSSFANSVNIRIVPRNDGIKMLSTYSKSATATSGYLKNLNLSEETKKHVCSIVTNNPSIFLSPVSSSKLIFKNQFRFFHTRRSGVRITEGAKIADVPLATKKQTDEFDSLLKKYSRNPEFQKSLIDSYRIAATNISVNPEAAKPSVTAWLGKILFLTAAGYILYKLVFTKMFSFKVDKRNFSSFLGKMDSSMIETVDVRFHDVQGCDEVKKELQDVVSFLKNPTIFVDIGARLPKGVLMIGEPGVGKTLLAKAVAGEAGVPFFSVSGSEFDEMFVGLGASRVRSLFADARKHAPCVIFIDELDSICGKRTNSLLHPYANQTINQLLAEMDGFNESEGIVVIGATNRFSSLDKAAIRPGRFDTHVQVHKPDYLGRVALFELYLDRLTAVDRADKSQGGIDVSSLARATIGYTGADISNLVNQAAILCVLRGDAAVGMTHLWDADTKIRMGAVRSKPLEAASNRLTAYHEAGHAVVSYFDPNSINRLKLVTILPRGASGGHTSFIPKSDQDYKSKLQMKAEINALMGGRAAEEIANGTDNITTGVGNDMLVASQIARHMVQKLTMSDQLGLQVFHEVGCECGNPALSPHTAEVIDTEVARILSESYESAKSMLHEHAKEWHMLAESLLEYETLTGDDIELIFKGKQPKIALKLKEKTAAVSSSGGAAGNKNNGGGTGGSSEKTSISNHVEKVLDYFAGSSK